jgi:hypothetical protein
VTRDGELCSAELYQPAAGRFVVVGPMQAERFKLRGASARRDGSVLVATIGARRRPRGPGW